MTDISNKMCALCERYFKSDGSSHVFYFSTVEDPFSVIKVHKKCYSAIKDFVANHQLLEKTDE